MGLESLLIFTLLGGMAAGAYGFETVLARKREGERPWLLTLVVVILFVVACLASATHINDFGRAFASVFTNGTVNLGAAMVHEVLIAGIFAVLSIIDLCITLAKKETPYGLRAVTAVVGILVILAMGFAYTDSYANPVWCEAPATVIAMLGGSVAAGLAMLGLFGSVDYKADSTKKWVYASLGLFALGILLEIWAFWAHGASVVVLVIALIVGPVAGLALFANAGKVKSGKTLSYIMFALMFIAFAICRYAFYATMGI